MVHGISHDHQGHIRVVSQPGNTRFIVYLPTTSDIDHAYGLDESDFTDTPEYDSEHHHILVIDDEVTLSELLSEMLSTQGYRVSIEHDSNQALQTFTAHPQDYDLVITDQTMPGLTGSDLAAKMLSIRPDLPVVLCTGYSDEINEQSAKQIGIRAFVNKPINNRTLMNLVDKLLHP
jgi:CheY-like chemotaxis protein